MAARNLLIVLAAAAAAAWAQAATPSFRDFDKRAKSGERLNVVFFGASLTWGANATDPVYTSYRAQLGDWMEQNYPKAHFKFWDAAIGGTGSQLGVFRVDRDVLRRKPDLVFLDFTANDDIYSDNPETRASYESILRRLILDAKLPVVVMIFPFQWNVQVGTTDGMKGRDTHLAIAKAYGCPVGDAVVLAQERVKKGEVTIEELWPADGVHPGDLGYGLFADAARAAFEQAVKAKMVCAAPEKMLYAPTYMKSTRVRISTLTPLPAGWSTARPNLTAAWYDGLMSRWLDDEVVASRTAQVKNAEGKVETVQQKPERLRAKFNGTMVLLFGEETVRSCRYRAYIDGELVKRATGQDGKTILTEFVASGKMFGGTRQHAQLIAQELEPKEHLLEIEPLFEQDDEQELRLESICVAGGEATVRRAD